ncbi:MAG TPA: TrmH family RNA methyltransferase [Acidobacteriaceae bacterium]|nr:TrmH family RNA methyltransferase [Acidobacteriaceae bacterium]
MLSAADRARFTVVLVGARNPSNIGAAARAMRDFGFADLRFVNDYTAAFDAAQLEATKSAVGAADVMRRARAFPTLAQAVADCALVVGTTAIGERTLTQKVLPLQEAAPALLNELRASNGARVALLFGSEKTGLTNEQLSHCAWLTTIPMFAPGAAANGVAARHLSMNLGQAVAVCLYELSRGGLEGAKEIPRHIATPPTAEDRERLTQLLLDVMHVTEYTRRFPANAQEPLVRALVQSLGSNHAEAETWMGILRQILWSTRKK